MWGLGAAAAWLDGRLRIAGLAPGEPGDPGLFGPGSAVWHVARERVLILGGAAALLMQIAHPLVAEGVVRHSAYREDPLDRLGRTLGAVLSVSFGDRRQVEAAAAGVMRTHARVRGRLAVDRAGFPAGTRYDATDPELAFWVYATLVVSALGTYEALVQPLGSSGRAAYFEEAKRLGALFGVGEAAMPRTYADFVRAFDAHADALAGMVGPDAIAMAADILAPPLPPALRPIRRALRATTASLLPAGLRRAYGLPEPRHAAGAQSVARNMIRAVPEPLRFWPAYHVAVARCGGSPHGRGLRRLRT